MTSPLLILVAGPCHSGTDDDPVLIANNVEAMTDASLALFHAGHLPLMGDWFALPLIEHAGSKRIRRSRRRWRYKQYQWLKQRGHDPVNLKSLQIEPLNIDARLDLVEALWDSIASSAALTNAQRDELDRRLAEHRQHPDEVVPWRVGGR